MTAEYIQSRQVPRQRSVHRALLPLLITLVTLVALLFGAALLPLREGRDAWLRGDDRGAIAIGEKWSTLHLWPSQYHHLQG